MPIVRVHCLLILLLADCRQQYFRRWAECVAAVVLVKTLLFSLHLMHDFILVVNGYIDIFAAPLR